MTIAQLPPDELHSFAEWFDDDIEDQWNQEIEHDVRAGRLDAAARRAEADFEADRCTPL